MSRNTDTVLYAASLVVTLAANGITKLMLIAACNRRLSRPKCGHILPRDAMSSCVRLSVTSCYYIETIGRIELVLVMVASFHLSHTVL